MSEENKYEVKITVSEVKETPPPRAPQQQSKSNTWPVIVLALILFWPIGVFLMNKRLKMEKTDALQKIKTISITGYGLFAMAFVYLTMALQGQSQYYTAAIFWAAGGSYLLYDSKKRKLKGEKHKKYFALVMNESHHHIDNIAAAAGVSYEEAKRDLQNMIDEGYFSGAYIHEANREFILKSDNSKQDSIDAAAALETSVVACKGCGANNTVTVGQASKCEYCGSPLQ